MKLLKAEIGHIGLYGKALLKWLVLAGITGVLCGLLGTAFYLGIGFVTQLRQTHAWLLWCLPHGPRRWWRALLSAQGVTALGLLPLTVWFFGQASVAGPLCNLVAVPWVSLVVVPVALAGTALELLVASAGTWAFRLSAWLMELLWRALEPVATMTCLATSNSSLLPATLIS